MSNLKSDLEAALDRASEKVIFHLTPSSMDYPLTIRWPEYAYDPSPEELAHATSEEKVRLTAITYLVEELADEWEKILRQLTKRYEDECDECDECEKGRSQNGIFLTKEQCKAVYELLKTHFDAEDEQAM